MSFSFGRSSASAMHPKTLAENRFPEISIPRNWGETLQIRASSDLVGIPLWSIIILMSLSPLVISFSLEAACG